MKRLFVFSILIFALVTVFTLPVTAEPAFELRIREAWVIPDENADSLPLNIVINNPMELDTTYTLVGAEATIGEVLLPDASVMLTPGLNVWDAAGGQLALTHIEQLHVGDAFALNLMLADESGTAYDFTVGVLIVEEAPQPAPFELILPWVRPLAEVPMDGDMSDMEATEEAQMGDMSDMEATEEAQMGDMGDMDMGGLTAAYMLLVNVDESDHTLVSVSSPIVGDAQLHQTIVENDVARMVPQEDGLLIPANGFVLLAPGGYHIMLINVTQPLVEGDALPLTLTFENGLSWEVALPVYDATFASLDLQFELEAPE